jgi:type IV secretory pathway VirB10-like protein
MRVIGRYFTIGATLGSVSGLVMLVLIWAWMTLHLGLFGFLVGWIPAGLAAAAAWLTMVLFWGPILIVGAMISAALLLLRAHPGREWTVREPPAASDSDERSTDAAPERETDQAEPPDAEYAPPATSPSPPPIRPGDQAATIVPPATAAPLATPAPSPRPSEDLNSDAAAAGDTSHRPQR